MTETTIGLIGIGLLGTALAERLQASGLRVLGYDIDESRHQQLRTLGGSIASSASDVARDCPTILLSLPDSTVVSEVLDKLPLGTMRCQTIVDTTTGDPAVTTELARSLQGADVNYLDATVAGSSEQARRGDITIMVGGDPDVVAQARWLLDRLAKSIFHIGAAGSGARMKLIVNLVLGLNRAVLAEGLSLAANCGLDSTVALEVLKAGAAYSAAMDSKGGKMVRGDFAPQARLSQHLKDVDLILQLASQSHVSLPLSERHRSLLAKAVELGYGDADNSAVIRAYQNT
ncbi:MAG: 6-phosphogluconate dehydrogenase [Planctomycetaceae bacterium]|nr:6-phosphogluconate dehydrogenase [Planctomycetaceae bacterium]